MSETEITDSLDRDTGHNSKDGKQDEGGQVHQENDGGEGGAIDPRHAGRLCRSRVVLGLECDGDVGLRWRIMPSRLAVLLSASDLAETLAHIHSCLYIRTLKTCLCFKLGGIWSSVALEQLPPTSATQT